MPDLSMCRECINKMTEACQDCLDSGTFIHFIYGRQLSANPPVIIDSGDRTEFSTGAVRDMHSGKGRFDLLPWYGIWEVSKHCELGAQKYSEHNVDKGIPEKSLFDSACRHLAKYQLGETDEDHLRAAAWNILWILQQRYTHPNLNDMNDWRKD